MVKDDFFLDTINFLFLFVNESIEKLQIADSFQCVLLKSALFMLMQNLGSFEIKVSRN